MSGLTRLLQLASPALPVGAYTYSQGLEWAVECGTVTDETSALRWISDQLELNLARFEAPLLMQFMNAWAADDAMATGQLDAVFMASRESAELRAETVQMGYSLIRLVNELGGFPAEKLEYLAGAETPSFLYVWTCLAEHWEIAPADALTAWLWSWAENQVMAAIKAVPLGQAGGQRILLQLGTHIPRLVALAGSADEASWSNFAPGFAIACACHETQYSRLFRS
jgi:urease accessory protein